MSKYSQTEHPNPPDCGTETAEEERERIKEEDRARIEIADLRVGQKVHYQPDHYLDDEWENGIIKEIREGKNDGVWVVYHCNGEWGNFAEYTGALTNLRDIKLGWRMMLCGNQNYGNQS